MTAVPRGSRFLLGHWGPWRKAPARETVGTGQLGGAGREPRPTGPYVRAGPRGVHLLTCVLWACAGSRRSIGPAQRLPGPLLGQEGRWQPGQR